MFKKSKLCIFGLLGVWVLSGCATGRNYQSDMDALNARVNALQGQVSAKDEELTRLRSAVSESESSQRAALAKAENENGLLTEKLNDALAKLESAAKPAAKKTRKKTEESDLK